MTDGSDPPPLPSASPPEQPLPARPSVEGGETQPEAVNETVLARGHLHPAILLLRLVDAGRGAIFPMVIGIVEPWFLVGAIALFLLTLGHSVIRYLTLAYTLTPEELRIREGLIFRQERRIPLDRIQDLGFESTILRRALGLSVVMVETASGQGVEARLDALSKVDAEHLREVLLAARPADAPRRNAESQTDGEATTDAPPQPAAAAPEWTVHASATGELLARGATDMRLGAFLLTGYAAYELADQLGFASQVAGVAGSIRDWLSELSPLVLLGVLSLLLFVVMAFGVIASMFGNVFLFYGFRLVLRGDVLQRRYGLLTTRQKTLPRARVQRVTLEQSWLRRLLGFAVVKADSAGGTRTDGQDVSNGWDVVVPMARSTTAYALLPALLPGIEKTSFEWHRGSPKLVVRTTIQGALLALIATTASWWRLGPNALWFLLVIPTWAVLGVLVWRNLGWARGNEFFALQHGIIGKTFACVPTAKVQAAVVRRGPVSQLLGLADITVYVAGGSPTRLPDLTLHDARVLCRDLSERAAKAAAADW